MLAIVTIQPTNVALGMVPSGIKSGRVAELLLFAYALDYLDRRLFGRQSTDGGTWASHSTATRAV